VWDRYDPRDGEQRDRDASWDHPRGNRGARSERDDDRVFDPRDVFVRAVDLPLDVERVSERSNAATEERLKSGHSR